MKREKDIGTFFNAGEKERNEDDRKDGPGPRHEGLEQGAYQGAPRRGIGFDPKHGGQIDHRHNHLDGKENVDRYSQDLGELHEGIIPEYPV